MNVFCALITMTGSSGRSFLMRGKRSNAFSSGITTSVMTRSPSPWLTQRHSVAALPVERTSYPARESAWFSTVLIAAVVVGDQYVSCRHSFPLQVPPPGKASSPVNIGIKTRKMVWRGCDSHSMIPP